MNNFIVGTKDENPDVKEAYKRICAESENFGKYYKTLFHVHTPESYDYKFHEEWNKRDYKRKTEEDILNEFFNLLGIKENTNYLHEPEEISYFDNAKQFWAFMAMAKIILNEKIELVVVADHNTLKGIQKLDIAIKNLKQHSQLSVIPVVVGGVEISCADKVHVVGIFDKDNNNMTGKIEKWLEENLISVKDGVYKTSLEVINMLVDIGAIPYIAHINTSDIFKEGKFLSGGYRDLLLSNKKLSIFGTKKTDAIEGIHEKLSQYRKGINIVLDNDSHCLEEINRNVFWIKGEKRNFDMVAEALNDYDISVSLEHPVHSNFYISGVLVEPKHPENTNFLIKNQSNTNESFVIKFSNALNCIIGGRGTGKSTLLRLLEFALSLRCTDNLKHLCMHGNVWILFEKDTQQYMVGMLMPYLDNEKANKFTYLEPYKFERNNYQKDIFEYNMEKAKRTAIQKNLKIYKVEEINERNDYKLNEIHGSNEKLNILNMLYDTSYSVNELVNIAGNEKQLTSFLTNRFINEKQFPKLSKRVRFKNLQDLKAFIEKMPTMLEKRAIEIDKIIKPFNQQENSTLKIKYKQLENLNENFPFEKCFKYSCFKDDYKYFDNFNISKKGILNYLYFILGKVSIIEFFNMIINDRQKMYKYSILRFARNYEKRGIVEINVNNQVKVIDRIIEEILSNDNINSVIREFFIDYLNNIEIFELEFDISSNSDSGNNIHDYRNVKELSLGQKVVAMLSFILAFSNFSQDFRPLLIDQPEDNLDSQYIYENLVEQLRRIKDKRQVIIATHNATIVTNAMADHVCVMKSDGKHGWIERRGYPGTERIKKSIINYLEGGVKSFKHKEKIYRKVLDENN